MRDLDHVWEGVLVVGKGLLLERSWSHFGSCKKEDRRKVLSNKKNIF